MTNNTLSIICKNLGNALLNIAKEVGPTDNYVETGLAPRTVKANNKHTKRRIKPEQEAQFIKWIIEGTTYNIPTLAKEWDLNKSTFETIEEHLEKDTNNVTNYFQRWGKTQVEKAYNNL